MPISSASRNCRIWSFLPCGKPAGNRVISVRREYRFDRKMNGTVTDGGHPGFGFTRRLEMFDALGERSQQRFRLQQRQHPAHTGMYAMAETEVIPIVSAHVETIRRLPASRVAVGGGEHQAATFACRNDETLDLHILHRNASGHARG